MYGSKSEKTWNKEVDGTFAAEGLFYEAQLTDNPESPLYNASEIFGYWEGPISNTIIILYRDGGYKMVVYDVGTKDFQEVHEMQQGERDGIPVFCDTRYDKYYVWDMENGNTLEWRSREDLNTVVETYQPVIWRTEESLKEAGIAAIATRKGFSIFKVGDPYTSPESIEGLYDSRVFVEKVHEGDEIDEDYEGDYLMPTWTERYWSFTKDGKEVFRINVERATITSYELLEGSNNIQTIDGIYAGMPIKELYEHYPDLVWEGSDFNDEITTFRNNFIFSVHQSDIKEDKWPENIDDFKPDAVIRSIQCCQ